MQVNDSEFFISGGGSQPVKVERPGDGLFDALLRDEEARYEEARPRETDRSEAYRRDDDRPEDHRMDDRRPEDHRADGSRRDANRDEEGADRDRTDSAGNDGYEDRDPPGDANEHASGHRPDSEDRSEQASGNRGGDQSEDARTRSDTAPTVRPVAGKSETQDANGKIDSKLSLAGLASNQAAKTVLGSASEGGTAKNTAQASSNDSAAASSFGTSGAKPTDAVASAVAAQPAVRTSAKGGPDTASPAKPATVNKPAVTAESMAASGPNAKTPSALQADKPAANASNPAAGKAAPDDLLITTSHAGLTSRPTAALAGAATTAAMVEEAKPAATNASGSGRTKAKTGDAQLAAVSASQRPGAPKAKTGQMTEPSGSAVKGDKPSITASSAGNITFDTLNVGSSGGQGQPTTALGSGLPGGSVQNASFTEALNTARGGGTPAPAEQIALQVQKAQLAGKDQLNIKLHPAELGRIEVKLENGDDGVLRAVISAERSETLDLLQRDTRGLERALQEAGVKTDSGSLSFNLKGQQQPGQEESEGQSASRSSEAEVELNDPAAPPPPPLARHDGALDIRV